MHNITIIPSARARHTAVRYTRTRQRPIACTATTTHTHTYTHPVAHADADESVLGHDHVLQELGNLLPALAAVTVCGRFLLLLVLLLDEALVLPDPPQLPRPVVQSAPLQAVWRRL